MPKIGNLKEYLLWWNLKYPADRWYRQKHNIGFNSKEHRNLCQIDIKLEFLESQLFEEHQTKFEESANKIAKYNKDKIWFTPKDLKPEEESMLFEDVDITKIDNLNFGIVNQQKEAS